MRLLAIAMLAAVLGAGCALEAGDPGTGAPGANGQDTSGSTLSFGQGRVPKAHALAAAPQGASSVGTMDNPDPAPWMVGGQGTSGASDDSTGSNPDPAPWHDPGEDTVQGYGSQPQPGGNAGSGAGGNASTSAQGHGPRIGHWDVKQLQESQ